MRPTTRWFLAAFSLASIAGVTACGGDERTSLAALSSLEQPLSTGLVISQVFGGAGNPGATYASDYVELFNRGTTTISVSGWSVQYTPATTAAWVSTPLPAKSIPPGGYFLLQLYSIPDAGTSLVLPTADATGSATVSGYNAKVALVAGTTVLTCASGCATAANVVDFVGFGSANDFEGAAAAAITETTATVRKGGGCTETDNNANDFVTSAPNPRNASTTTAPCVVDAGTDTGGPDTGGPDTGGPDTGGPDTGGSDTATADAADETVVDATAAEATSDTMGSAETASVDTAAPEDTAEPEDTSVADAAADTVATLDATADGAPDAALGELDLPAGKPTCSCRTPAGATPSATAMISAALTLAAITTRRRSRRR